MQMHACAWNDRTLDVASTALASGRIRTLTFVATSLCHLHVTDIDEGASNEQGIIPLHLLNCKDTSLKADQLLHFFMTSKSPAS